MTSFFFFQAEDGIRDGRVTGVQTCALPILRPAPGVAGPRPRTRRRAGRGRDRWRGGRQRMMKGSKLAVADTSVPVVALTMSPNPLLHGSLNVVRSLGRLGVPVHVMHPRAWTPADHSRYLAGKVIASYDDDA